MELGEIAGLLASLGEREDQILERIIAWSNQNSGSYNVKGVGRMAALLGAELERLTPNVALTPVSDVEEVQDDGSRMRFSLGPAVRAVCRPEAPVQVLLNGHIDTVFGVDHPFQKARREQGRLIGPGVTDMKGGLAVMIESLRILESSTFRHRLGWEVILNPDEEIGSPGSSQLLVEAAGRHQAGFIFEPALPDGNLVSGRMGTGNFLIRVLGRSAHVGRDFGAGRSAIVALAKLIGNLHEINRKNGMIVNVGRISGGGALNIVPAAASCRLNVRAESAEKAAWIESRVREIVAETGEQEGIEVGVDGGFARPPKSVTPALESMLAEFKTCARELGFDLTWKTTGGGSDGNILAAAGLPVVDSLGLRGGAIHTPDEFLQVESVTERISLTACFLLKVARGDITLPVSRRGGTPI